MPLYEYECESCGTRIEKIRKFSDPPLTTCEGCGGPLRKLFSSPAIQFKGSGWYITDYARKTAVEGTRPDPAKGKTDSAPAASSGESGAGSAGSEGKPAGAGGSTSGDTKG